MMSMPRGPERNEQMKKNYYKLAVGNPGIVAWYCAWRLEAMLLLYKRVVSAQLSQDGVSGLMKSLTRGSSREDASKHMADVVAEQLEAEDLTKDLHIVSLSLPSYGKVHDYWASFEWSAGGMVHIHIALWIIGAPRIDKVVMEDIINTDKTMMNKHGKSGQP